MSKGEIVGHLGEGKYRVRQKLAVDRINELLGKLNERIAELAVDLPEAKLELLQAEDAAKDKVREIDLMIYDLQAGVEGAREGITKLQGELIELQAAVRMAELKVSELIAENLSALKRRGQLESVPEGREIEAWCADYTLDLSGDVGLVDVNDEGGQGVVIQPGFDSGATYDPLRDGALFPNLAQSGPQIYFNAAVLPGVQKWMPRYRVGEIIRLQTDICDVRLDSAQSSVQGLPINEAELLTGIPIIYMDCNGSAFTEGDRVVVRFTTNGPLVIGFESDPVPCSLFGFVFEPARWEAGPAPTYQAAKTTYGEPFENMSGQINPPLGTIGGANNAWTATPDASDLTIQRGNARLYGNKNWFNTEKLVLSWDGPPGRAHRLDQIDDGFNGFLADWKTGPNIFHDLEIIFDLSEEATAGAFVNVHGAAMYEDVSGQRWLVVVASDESYATGQTFRVFRITVDALLQPFGLLQFLHETTLMPGMAPQTHFYFSADGTKAVCTIVGDLEDDENLHIDLVRYDINSGFSLEQLWTRNQAIGTLTDDFTWSESGSLKSGTAYRTIQSSAHNIPIYCDYIGDREVIAYESWPSVSLVADGWYNYDASQVDYSREYPAPITQWSGGRTINAASPDVFSIITSDGETLFRMPYGPSESRSFSYDYFGVAAASGSDDDGPYYQPGYGTYDLSNSEDTQVGGIDWEENLLSIDLRFAFCAVSYGGYKYTLSETISTTHDDPDFSDGGKQATGTITGNEIVEIVQFWLGGSMVVEEEAQRIAGPMEIGAYSQDPINLTGVNGSNTSTESDITPGLPLEISSRYLLTAAAYRSGPHSVGSVGMNYNLGGSSRKPVLLNHVSGYDDPVSEILERTESSGYLLCSVGLI